MLPKDAVAGIPTEYGAAIIANTLSLLATITTTDELLQLWQQHADGTSMTDTADTAPEAHSVGGGFPEIKPADHAPPGLGRFVAALRRLQDLTVSTDPGSAWSTAAQHVEDACALLDGHQVPADAGTGRASHRTARVRSSPDAAMDASRTPGPTASP